MHIEPFDMKYLNDYFNEFNEDITKYQWPDPFENLDVAKEMLQGYVLEAK